MSITLYTSYYNEVSENRRHEILECLKKNAQNQFIKRIVILNEADSLQQINESKIEEIFITQRPTYNDFIKEINQNRAPDQISIIANSDIYFDNQIELLLQICEENSCIALSRWELLHCGKSKLYNRGDSQDTWIFKGEIKSTLKADFPMGVPRCDNRLAYELNKAGYRVINPSYSLKSYHLHHREKEIIYCEEDNQHKIAPPYRYLNPHNLYGFWKTLHFNLKHKTKLAHYRYDIKKTNLWWPVRLYRKIWETVTKQKMKLIGY